MAERDEQSSEFGRLLVSDHFRIQFGSNFNVDLIKFNSPQSHHNCPSPYFNINNYPAALDYEIPGKVELPGQWLKIQSASRNLFETFAPN